ILLYYQKTINRWKQVVKITLFFCRYFHQFLVTDQRRIVKCFSWIFYQRAFSFKIKPIAVTSQKPGIFFQAEAVFFPFCSTEKHLLVSSEGRFLPLNTGAFQDQVVFRLDGTI